MKKQLMAISLAAALFIAPIAASPEAVPNTLGKGYTHSVGALAELGMLKGTGNSLELDRAPTRAEAITMIVRLDSGEDEINGTEYDHPFTDVPEWADGYVGYAYENGITKGVSDTLFDSASPVTGQQYVTMVLRTLGYTDGGTYYGHSFTYETPFGLAELLGLLHAVRNGETFYKDPASFNMNFEPNFIGERIRQSFNREYMAYITFNALTCLKVDEEPSVTLFEATMYGKTDIENERLYEIFRHRQIPSDDERAVIVSKPHHKSEFLPYELTVDGVKYTLDGRNMIKLHQDGSFYSRATYDNYYLPMLATFELLGIDCHMEGNKVIASYGALSPDVSRVTAVKGDGRDEGIYKADMITLYMNGEEITPKKRIAEAMGTGLGSTWIDYADCFYALYKGELYVQTDILAAALGMDTDYVTAIFENTASPVEQTVNKNLDILISDIGSSKKEKDYISAHPEAFEAIVSLGEDALPYLKSAASDHNTESDRRKMAMTAAYAIKPELYDLVYPSPDGIHSLVFRVESFFNDGYHKDQVTTYSRADIIENASGKVICSTDIRDSSDNVYQIGSVNWHQNGRYVYYERSAFLISTVTDMIDVKNAVKVNIPSVRNHIIPLLYTDFDPATSVGMEYSQIEKWRDDSSVKIKFSYGSPTVNAEGTYSLNLETGEISELTLTSQ